MAPITEPEPLAAVSMVSAVALPALTVTVPLLADRVPTTACTRPVPTRWPVKVVEAPLVGLRSLVVTPPVVLVMVQVALGLATKLP